MKSWDVIVLGGGIIGISIAIAMRKLGASVLVVERGAAGREASHAAAGMLACCDPHLSPLLQPLALASARLYPEFVHELEDESGERVDYRTEGTILLWNPSAEASRDTEVHRTDPISQGKQGPPVQREALNPGCDIPPQSPGVPHPERSEGWESTRQPCPESQFLTGEEVAKLEPGLRIAGARASYLPEACVDPRALVDAALKAAKHRGIELASGMAVVGAEITKARVSGVRTAKTRFLATTVINCCGAWTGQPSPLPFPIRPIKGQMLARVVPVAFSDKGSPWSPRTLSHVVRAPDVYLVPRSDGRVVIGSTLEDVGFDKRVDADVIHTLDQRACTLLPELRATRILESWTGLRPVAPDHLPILGKTSIEGYFVATGHYRDGILLAPITAELMAQVIQGLPPGLDISAFSASRFHA